MSVTLEPDCLASNPGGTAKWPRATDLICACFLICKMRIMPTSNVGIKQIIVNRLDELVFVKNSEECLAPSECSISGPLP